MPSRTSLLAPFFALWRIVPGCSAINPIARVALRASVCLVLAGTPAGLAWGQQATPADRQTQPQVANLQPKPEEPPPARDLTLETRVRGKFMNAAAVKIACTWFAGTHKRDTVPVIMLHNWGSNRGPLIPLAQQLQRELGCAVLVPDLRGHGESTKLVGSDKRLKAAEFNNAEISLAAEDLEACKRFLKEQHNAGELNLEMLTIIACGQTTALAAAWSAADWEWPPYKGTKQGQDVKLLVLLSPVRKFETFNLSGLVKTPLFSEPKLAGLTTALFWDSNDEESERNAAALEAVLATSLGPVPAAEAPDRWAKTRYSLKVVPNGGIGESLLAGPSGESVRTEIANFIEQKLARRAAEYPWNDRSEK